MIRIICTAIFVSFSATSSVVAGEFIGELELYPEGCQQSDSRKCKLNGLLTYKSSRKNKLVWQTDSWRGDKFESGTTDGASIPGWAQDIIGDPYDPSYLKAAIVHDHYCYEENRVRSWRDTHRMFYDALIDLRVLNAKAKIMYFSVYAFGPHWIEIVAGENCGENCIKTLAPTSRRWEGPTYGLESSQLEIAKMKALIEADDSMSLDEIEARAKKLKPNDFFFNNGDTYAPTGPKDPNLLPVR